MYTIENRRLIEYTVSQKTTNETLEGVDVKFYITNKGVFKPVNTKELHGDYFTDKEQAETTLAIVNKYA